MAMTKAEKQYQEGLLIQLEDALLRVARAKSLRFSGLAPDPDIIPAKLAPGVAAIGYTYNPHQLMSAERLQHDQLAVPVVTEQNRHHYGDHNLQAPNWSQRGVAIFSRRIDALRARRVAMENAFAAALHDMDCAIAAELGVTDDR